MSNTLKEKIAVFAIKDNCCSEYAVEDDYDKVLKFSHDFGYAFSLTVSSELVKLTNEIKAVKRTIDTLTAWRKESWFELNKTSADVWWPYITRLEERRVTLPQANKIYKELKIKHDLLILMIKDTFRIHGNGKECSMEELLTEIELA